MTRTLAPRDPTCLLMFLFFHSPLSGALWPCAPLIAREFESIPITVAIAALHLAPNGTPLAAVAPSGVRSPVAVSYRHMYATGVVHTVLGWYAVRARSVISYSTTIRPSTAYNVLQYLHEDRRPGDPTPGVIPQCSEAENGSITLRSGGFVYSSGCRQQGHRFARTVHWSKHST